MLFFLTKHNFKECARRFPVPLYGRDNSSKQDKFVLSFPADQLKAVVTLTGDSITSAVSIYVDFVNMLNEILFFSRILISK